MSRVKSEVEVKLLAGFKAFLENQPGGTKRLSEPMNIQHASMFEAFKAGMNFQFFLQRDDCSILTGTIDKNFQSNE